MMKPSSEKLRTDDAPLLELERVTKRFGAQVVLREVSLTIGRGEQVVIMGSSGTGKTILLKHLIGLARPDEGAVRIAGEDLWAATELRRNQLRRRFGMAFQEGALFDSMTVFDNVAFPLRRHARLGGAALAKRVAECLELVHLPGAATKRPSELSTGMRRRVGFARAIALEPEILLFDEPTAGLDPPMVHSIDEVIRELATRLHITTVVTTHDLRTAYSVGARLLLLGGGALVADAPRERFFGEPHPQVQQLLDEGLLGLPPRPAQAGSRR